MASADDGERVIVGEPQELEMRLDGSVIVMLVVGSPAIIKLDAVLFESTVLVAAPCRTVWVTVTVCQLPQEPESDSERPSVQSPEPHGSWTQQPA